MCRETGCACRGLLLCHYNWQRPASGYTTIIKAGICSQLQGTQEAPVHMPNSEFQHLLSNTPNVWTRLPGSL